jgi:hypothetical protein
VQKLLKVCTIEHAVIGGFGVVYDEFMFCGRGRSLGL